MGIARTLGITLGAVVILGAGIYGPATLLGPLPEPTVVTTDAVTAPPQAPVLPPRGASAITESGESAPFAASGGAEPVPIAGIAKIVTALVILDAHPIASDAEGVKIPISADDYRSYVDYAAGGYRTVTVYTEDTWSLRGMLQAIVLGSSNNHADALARWSFGSIDDYLVAAHTWLTDHGFTETTIVDATGLSPLNTASAEDLARLSALALDNTTFASLLSSPVTGIAEQRGVTNTTSYLPEAGVTGISLSYTDGAGICLLFAGRVDNPESPNTPYTFYGAIVGEPDWASLETDVRALMASAEAGVVIAPAVAEGESVARLTTAWGETTDAIVGASPERPRWDYAPASRALTINPPAVAAAGTSIGSLSVTQGGTLTSIPVVLGAGLTDPGPLWRLSHPFAVIPRWIQSFQFG